MIKKLGYPAMPDNYYNALNKQGAKINELIGVVNALVRFQYHQQFNKTVSWDTLEEYEQFLRDQVESE